MTASDATALMLALLADAVGLAVVIGLWRRSRRRRRAIRSRHPSVRAPLTVGLVAEGHDRALRIAVLPGAPPIALDIVSFRPARPDGPWDSVPLVAPVAIAPGAHHRLPVTLPAETRAADVVVAWTARHPTGDVEGSRLFRLPPERDVPAPLPPRVAVLAGRPAMALVVLLLAAGAFATASALDGGDRADPGPERSSTSSTSPSTAPTTTTAAAAATTLPVSVAPSTTVAATASTVVAATTVPPAVAATTTVPASTPRVLVDARIAPCRFGEECLIVGFRIEDFTTRPQEYACEFDDGSRFTFRFDSDGVEDACATGNTDAEITIEIDGIRSDTVTRADATTN